MEIDNDQFDGDPDYNPDDIPTFGWEILAFFFPILGIIMSFSNQNKFPFKSKRYMELAFWGIGVAFVLKLFIGLLFI